MATSDTIIIASEKEEWRIVPEFPDYAVSDTGRLKRITPANNTYPGKILKRRRTSEGYSAYRLTRHDSPGPREKTIHEHYLVITAFIGPQPSPKHEIAHKDGTRTNNRPENLMWATHAENMSHQIEHGTRRRGVDIKHIAKINDGDAMKIIQLCAEGISTAIIASMFKITGCNVRRIIRGKQWSHISSEHRDKAIEMLKINQHRHSSSNGKKRRKLTMLQAEEIRRERAMGAEVPHLSIKYGICEVSIYRIIWGEAYKDNMTGARA